MQAGNNITSQTLTTRDPGNAANIQVLAQAGIEAKNSVTAVAGNDVSITGSTLNAGGDIALQAGRNMTVDWSEKVNPLLGQRQSGVGG